MLRAFYEQLFGYGEKPWRLVRAAVAVVLLFALFYMPWSSLAFSLAGLATLLQRFGQALYFSGVSFTALGYGDWVAPPTGFTKYLGVVESLLGISLIALFLVTFTRKMSR